MFDDDERDAESKVEFQNKWGQHEYQVMTMVMMMVVTMVVAMVVAMQWW